MAAQTFGDEKKEIREREAVNVMAIWSKIGEALLAGVCAATTVLGFVLVGVVLIGLFGFISNMIAGGDRRDG